MLGSSLTDHVQTFSWNLESLLLYVSCKHGLLNIRAGKVVPKWFVLMKMIRMMIHVGCAVMVGS
jgi:hypothetical protein